SVLLKDASTVNRTSNLLVTKQFLYLLYHCLPTNFLKFNNDTTEVLLIGAKTTLSKLNSLSLIINKLPHTFITTHTHPFIITTQTHTPSSLHTHTHCQTHSELHALTDTQ